MTPSKNAIVSSKPLPRIRPAPRPVQSANARHYFLSRLAIPFIHTFAAICYYHHARRNWLAGFQAAMAFLRAEVAKLSETELFDALNSLPRPLDDSTAASSKRGETNAGNGSGARGGGGIQGPSPADAVDVDKLLAEMSAGPVSRA